MDSLNTKVSNILDTDNWSDALLIKDEKGNLGYLKPRPKGYSPKTDSQINLVSEGALAPQDDSFVPMPNITGTSQDKSELVFHPNDKEELDFFAKNIPTDDSKKYSIAKIVDRIIDKQNLDLDDKNKKIFSNILYNFFRNRKSVTIIRELLTNNVLIKNKKLSTDTIDTILSVIKSIKSKIDLAGGLVVNQSELKAIEQIKKIEDIPEEKDQSLSAQDEIKVALGKLPVVEPKVIIKEESKPAKGFAIKPKTLDKIIQDKKEPVLPARQAGMAGGKPKVQESKPARKPAEGFSIPSSGKEEVKTTEDSIEDLVKDPDRSGGNQSGEKSKLETETEQKTDTSLPKVSRPSINQAPNKPISDVSIPIKEKSKQDLPLAPSGTLMGAIEELESFDLVGFRRLGDTAEERIQKIFDKINLLEEESYTKKAQGITAWRASEVYRLYLKLGTESMVVGQEIANFITEQANKNKDVLTIEEFSAISDLNKQLRF